MGNVRDDLSLSGLELVVLARLSVRPHTKPPGVPELGKAVRELALPSESPARAKEVALETLAALRARGLVSQSSSARKGQLGERSLTDDGGRALRAALGLARTPHQNFVLLTQHHRGGAHVRCRVGRAAGRPHGQLDPIELAVQRT